MTAEEIRDWLYGLSEVERELALRFLTQKKNEMQQAAHYGLVRRLV